MHLLADISGHGFGHLAIGAPVLNALAKIRPDWRWTVRSQLPERLLHERLHMPFCWRNEASDFGFLMHDALRIDQEASANAYRHFHADWDGRVDAEAERLRALGVSAVLTNVAYLPLAAAARLGLPAWSLCSLNWADLFQHYFGHEDWAAPIHAQMLAAYRSVRTFLRATPGMAMPDFPNLQPFGPLSVLGQRQPLGLGRDKVVLVAMGGISHRLPIEHWPRLPGLKLLVPTDWQIDHPDTRCSESFGLNFTDLLCSADAVLTKPGYGTFTEAACNGTPVLYQKREDWPEQDCLIAWLHQHATAREIAANTLLTGEILDDLNALWTQVRPEPPDIKAADAAAQFIVADWEESTLTHLAAAI